MLRPSSLCGLDAAETVCNAGIQRAVDAPEVMLKKDLVGRDGRIGLQGENPVAVRLPASQQGDDTRLNSLLHARVGRAQIKDWMVKS